MKNFVRIVAVLFLLAGMQYANGADDVVRVQRAINQKHVDPPVLNTKNSPAQVKPVSELDIAKQKSNNLEKAKQYSTNLAKNRLNMSVEEAIKAPICDVKYTLEDLGATGINIIYYNEPNMDEFKKDNIKIHGWGYKPKKCVKVAFNYDNKPYYTMWCR